MGVLHWIWHGLQHGIAYNVACTLPFALDA